MNMLYKDLEFGSVFEAKRPESGENDIFTACSTIGTGMFSNPYNDTRWYNAHCLEPDPIEDEFDYPYFEPDTPVKKLASSIRFYYYEKHLELAYKTRCEFCRKTLLLYVKAKEISPRALYLLNEVHFIKAVVKTNGRSLYTFSKIGMPNLYDCPNCLGLLYFNKAKLERLSRGEEKGK